MADQREVAVLIDNLTHCVTTHEYTPQLYPDAIQRYMLSDCGLMRYGAIYYGTPVTCIWCIAKRRK